MTYCAFLVLRRLAACGVSEYRKVRFTWPDQRSILSPVVFSYFNVPKDSMGAWGPVFDETRSRSNLRPAAVSLNS